MRPPIGLFSVSPQGSWYGERKSAFGFSADGSLTRLPHITCKVSNPFPTPPPPSPPSPPPTSPPQFTASERACFLGGGAVFTDAPDTEPIAGWMRPWTVSITLERWIPGTRIVLDFMGTNLVAHPLKIFKVDPSEAVRRVEMTKHSLVVMLLESPVVSFDVIGSGAVEGMRDLNCCCDAPPPKPPNPPPPPRHRPSVPPSPPPPPFPPSPPPSPGTRVFTIVGAERPSPPIPPPPPFAPGHFGGLTGKLTSSKNMTVGLVIMCTVVALLGSEIRHRLKLRAEAPKALKLNGRTVHAVGLGKGHVGVPHGGGSAGLCGVAQTLMAPWSGGRRRHGSALVPQEDPDEPKSNEEEPLSALTDKSAACTALVLGGRSGSGRSGSGGRRGGGLVLGGQEESGGGGRVAAETDADGGEEDGARKVGRKKKAKAPSGAKGAAYAAAAAADAAAAASSAAANAAAAASAAAAMGGAMIASSGGRARTGPRICVQLMNGSFHELPIDVSRVVTMAQLQEAVADACEAGLPEVEQHRLGELVMQVMTS